MKKYLIVAAFVAVLCGCSTPGITSCDYIPGIDYTMPYLHTYYIKAGKRQEVVFFKAGTVVNDPCFTLIK